MNLHLAIRKSSSPPPEEHQPSSTISTCSSSIDESDESPRDIIQHFVDSIMKNEDQDLLDIVDEQRKLLQQKDNEISRLQAMIDELTVKREKKTRKTKKKSSRKKTVEPEDDAVSRVPSRVTDKEEADDQAADRAFSPRGSLSRSVNPSFYVERDKSQGAATERIVQNASLSMLDDVSSSPGVIADPLTESAPAVMMDTTTSSSSGNEEVPRTRNSSSKSKKRSKSKSRKKKRHHKDKSVTGGPAHRAAPERKQSVEPTVGTAQTESMNDSDQSQNLTHEEAPQNDDSKDLTTSETMPTGTHPSDMRRSSTTSSSTSPSHHRPGLDEDADDTSKPFMKERPRSPAHVEEEGAKTDQIDNKDEPSGTYAVVNREVVDPYGDVGTYTGSLLMESEMPHGLGHMVYQEEELERTYEGEWVNGRWHGHGKLLNANGDIYEGAFENDARHGEGCYKWSSGRCYVGEFSHDKRHGKGSLLFPDGSKYVGDFKEGAREGTGRCDFADGGYYDGEWKKNQFNGVGKCVWPDGRVYKGQFVANLANGHGVEYYADGTVRHDGLWENDAPVRS